MVDRRQGDEAETAGRTKEAMQSDEAAKDAEG